MNYFKTLNARYALLDLVGKAANILHNILLKINNKQTIVRKEKDL